MPDTLRALSYLTGTDFITNGQRFITAALIRELAVSAVGVLPRVATKTANYPATDDDVYIPVDATSGAVTITLPAVASTRSGKVYIIEKIDTSINAVIVQGNSAENIDGANTQILFTQGSLAAILNTQVATNEWLTIVQRGLAGGSIFIQKASAGVTVANTAAETTILGSGNGNLTLPANWYRVGRALRLKASGFLSDTGTPTLTLKAKNGSTVLASTGALTLGSGVSNVFFEMVVEIVCVATGASNTLWVQGRCSIGDGTNHVKGMVNTALVSVNTSASQVIDLTVQWGTGSSSNTLTSTNVEMDIVA